jgi:hypothetical protein
MCGVQASRLLVAGVDPWKGRWMWLLGYRPQAQRLEGAITLPHRGGRILSIHFHTPLQVLIFVGLFALNFLRNQL